MKRILGGIIVSITLASSPQGRAQAPAINLPSVGPKTKLQAFPIQAGSAFVRSYTWIGTAKGSGTVGVACLVITDASTGKKQSGLSVEVKDAESFTRTASCFVGFEEVDALILGIDYISKVDGSATELTGFEAVYRTSGDLSVTVFGSKSVGAEKASIGVGTIGLVTASIDLEQLSKFRDLLAKGKSKLDEVKAAK